MYKPGKGPLDDTTYQISKLYALWFQTRKIFHVAPFISLCKTRDPRGRAIFGNRAIILTNLVEVHKVMLHTKYKNSRPYGFRQDFLYFSLYKPM